MIHIALLALGAVSLLPQILSAQSWYQATTANDPGDSRDAAMAFCNTANHVVLFGGFPLRNDTWTYDGADWTHAAPSTVPPGRRECAMATDFARGVVVMFGGRGSSGALADTWEWNGTDWQNVTPAASPPGRIGHVMAWDALRNVTVLFGGAVDPFLPPALTDTWEWNGTTWTQVGTAHAPSESVYASMCFDTARNVCVLTGGTSVFGAPDQKTWEYDGTDWIDRTAAVGPGPSVGLGVQNAQMVFDPIAAVALLYGGRTPAGTFPTDTWQYDGTAWSIVATGTPSERVRFAMAFDLNRGVPVLYGGLDGTFSTWYHETWQYGTTPASYTMFGFGCPGSAGVPSNTASSLPVIGGTLTIEIGNLPIPEVMAIVLGNTQLGPIDLTGLGMPGCSGYVSPDFLALVTGSAGVASFSVPVPANPTLIGAEIHSQALVFEAGINAFGAIVSDAATATVGI